jgi:hypothetical protein
MMLVVNTSDWVYFSRWALGPPCVSDGSMGFGGLFGVCG